MWSGEADLRNTAARLREYRGALVRARLALLAWLTVWLAAGMAYALLVPAQFVARVEVEIGPRAVANDGPEVVRHYRQIEIDAEQAATELWVMGSNRVLQRVFDDLKLADVAELTSGSDGLLPFVAHLAHRVAVGGSSYDARERAYFAFQSRVLCLRVGGSYVFSLSYRSHDPKLAARVANAIASAYLADRLERERLRQAQAGGSYQVERREALERELQATRAAGAEGAAPADIYRAGARVLSPATPPLQKSFPKLMPTLAFCATIALVSGLVAALSRVRPGVPARLARSDMRAGQRLAESLD